LLYLLLLIPGGKAAQEHVALHLSASLNQATSATESAPYLTYENYLKDAIIVRSGKELKTPRAQADPDMELPRLPLCLVRAQEEVVSHQESRLTGLVEKSTIQGQKTRAPPTRPSLKLSLAGEHLP
jgi:hypothetical protein